MARFIKIDGILEIQDNINEDEFWEMFIDFIEERHWYFGGGIYEVDEEGNNI